MKQPTIKDFDHRLRRRGLTPFNMDRVRIEPELKTALGKIAMDIFIDASNSGAAVQEAVLAVYLSGLENGSAATLEQR